MVSREYPSQPVLAVAGCLFRGKEVLLVKRARPPGEGRWSIPGGVVELGEHLTQALQREMMEELGIEIEVLGLMGVFERLSKDQEGRLKYHYVIIDYYGIPKSKGINPNSEVEEYRWVPLDRLEEFMSDTVAIQAIRTAFLHYQQKGESLTP